MAADTLTGNLPTEEIVPTLQALAVPVRLDLERLADAVRLSREVLG